MINVRELRIGNFIEFNNYTVEVDDKTISDISNKLDGKSLVFSPYKLTVFWLIDFNFKSQGIFNNKVAIPGEPSGDMDGYEKFVNENDCTIYVKGDEFRYQVSMHYDDYGLTLDTKQIKYVHKLQNFHYEFCNEELEIK